MKKPHGRKSEIGVYANDLFLWRAQGDTYWTIQDKLEKKSGRKFHIETIKRFFKKYRTQYDLACRIERGRDLIEKDKADITSLYKLDKLIEKYEKKIETMWEKLQPKSLEGVINSYSKLIDIRSKITGEQKTSGNINISFGNQIHAKAFSKYVRRFVESKGESFDKFLVGFHRYLKEEHSEIVGMEEEEETIDIPYEEVEEGKEEVNVSNKI